MKLQTIRPPQVDQGLDQQFGELLKQRHKNTDRIAAVILEMIRKRNGAVNQKNTEFVVAYLGRKYNLPQETLRGYIKVGRGLLLPEIFNMSGVPAHYAEKLAIDEQRKLLFDGVKVVIQIDKPPGSRRLSELTDEQAELVINTKLWRLRTVKEQIQHLQNSIPAPSDRLVDLWSKSGWVKIRRRIPFGELIHLARLLKTRKFKVATDDKVRDLIERDLERDFPLSQGASQA